MNLQNVYFIATQSQLEHTYFFVSSIVIISSVGLTCLLSIVKILRLRAVRRTGIQPTSYYMHGMILWSITAVFSFFVFLSFLYNVFVLHETI